MENDSNTDKSTSIINITGDVREHGSNKSNESTNTDSTIIGASNNNLRILYITFAIIIALLLLWILIIFLTREDSVKILDEMNNLASQTPAVTDVKEVIENIIPENIVYEDSIIIPEGYVNTSIDTNLDYAPPNTSIPV
ncbi:Hypothetical protein HVR_LOCUS1135 [uncultured virus]|nr:Hypothetical protein HVR_LOCUS1135 [uncultured virus]